MNFIKLFKESSVSMIIYINFNVIYLISVGLTCNISLKA